MKKTVYIVYDEPKKGDGDIFETHPTFEREEAVKAARTAWNHLTTSEKKQREVYVGVHKVTVPDDDQRPAEQVYRDLTDEDEWPHDHDVIEVESEEDKTQEKHIWYALMKDADDQDWGTGTFVRENAIRKLRSWRKDYPDAYIAVIDDDAVVCIDEIHDVD